MTQSQRRVFPGLLLCALGSPATGDEKKIDEAELEARGALIGQLILVKEDVFDLADERENKALYRLVNKLHILTRDEVIQKQLLLESGKPYSVRLARESERILRSRNYLYDATIEPIRQRDGVVDVRVTTKDVWTLKPGVSVSRKGGENRVGVDIEEVNLFGYGQAVRIARIEDVDRTSESFEFRDPHIGNSWITGAVSVADNSDGHAYFGRLERPFHSLDARWSLGATVSDVEQRTALYSLGEKAAEYDAKYEFAVLQGGISAGLKDGWVRRYTAGIVFDNDRFSGVPDGNLPALVPDERRLIYPYVGVEILEDAFTTTSNKEQIGRTEDFFMGQHFVATLGYAHEALDSDREAWLFSSRYRRGFGSLESKALLTSAWTDARLEEGNLRNARLGFDARFYLQQSEKRMFFATAEGILGHELDLDTVVDLGGDTGLRGYPLRYQSGDTRVLFTVEQRYFWDWYPFRLFRIGGAVFADVGRVWGKNPVAERDEGWLRDVGFGLRFAPTRTGFRRVVHLDIAFPLDGDGSIDEVQILLESKKSF